MKLIDRIVKLPQINYSLSLYETFTELLKQNEQEFSFSLALLQPLCGLAMFPMWIRYTLKYYSLFCFHFIKTLTIGGKYITLLFFIFQIGLCVWCSYGSLSTFANEIATLMERLDALNFLLYYITSAITYTLIVCESFVNRSVENAFWCIFSHINEELCNQKNVENQKNVIISAAFCVIDVIIAVLSVTGEHTTSSAYLIRHHIFLIICNNHILFYQLHLNIIELQLRKLEMGVKRMPSPQTFKWIRKYYELIYGMCDHINTTFGWAHLASIVLNFHSILTFVNFIYRQIHRKFDRFDYGRHFTSMTLLMFDLIYFKLFVDILLMSSIFMVCRVGATLIFFNKCINDCYKSVTVELNLNWFRKIN